jgi:hypothetical protein
VVWASRGDPARAGRAKSPIDWDLTPRQADLLDALCEHGLLRDAAREIGIQYTTAKRSIADIKVKAGDWPIVLLALQWDRFKRETR